MTKHMKRKSRHSQRRSRRSQRGGQSTTAQTATLIGNFVAYGDGKRGVPEVCWDYCKGGILTKGTWNSLALCVVNSPDACYDGSDATKSLIQTIINSPPNKYIIDIRDLNNVSKFKFYCIGRVDTDPAYLSTPWATGGGSGAYQFNFNSSNIISQSGTGPGFETRYNVYYSIAPPMIAATPTATGRATTTASATTTLIGNFLAYGDGKMGMPNACWDFCKGGILTKGTWNSLALCVVNSPDACYDGSDATKSLIQTIINSPPNKYIIDIRDLNNVSKFKFYCIGRVDTDPAYLSTPWATGGGSGAYQFNFNSSNIISQSGTGPGFETRYNVYYSIAPPMTAATPTTTGRATTTASATTTGRATTTAPATTTARATTTANATTTRPATTTARATTTEPPVINGPVATSIPSGASQILLTSNGINLASISTSLIPPGSTSVKIEVK